MPELFDPDVKERKTNFKILSILDILYNIITSWIFYDWNSFFFFKLKHPTVEGNNTANR